MNMAYEFYFGLSLLAIHTGCVMAMGISAILRNWRNAFFCTLMAWWTSSDARAILKNPFNIDPYYHPSVHPTAGMLIGAAILFIVMIIATLLIGLCGDAGLFRRTPAR
jgi:hypothetical protein